MQQNEMGQFRVATWKRVLQVTIVQSCLYAHEVFSNLRIIIGIVKMQMETGLKKLDWVLLKI